jgi:hypothetical protein
LFFARYTSKKYSDLETSGMGLTSHLTEALNFSYN